MSQEDYDNQVAQQVHYYYADAYDSVSFANLPMPGTLSTIQVPRDVDGDGNQDLDPGPDGLPGTGDDIPLWDDQLADINPWIEMLGTTIDPGPDGLAGTPDDVWLDVPQYLNFQGDASGKIYAGLAVTSHNTAELTTGRFSNIIGLKLPEDLYQWFGADLDPGTYPGGIGEWRDANAWTPTIDPAGDPNSYPQEYDEVEIWQLGGPVIREAETVRSLKLVGAPGDAPQLIFDENTTTHVAGSLTIGGALDAGAGNIFVRASGASITAASGTIGGLVLGRENGGGGMDPADFALDIAGAISVKNLAGVGRLTMQGGGVLTLTDDISNLANRPIKADGIGFTVDHATLSYRNASNSIVDGFGTPFALGGSTGEIILDSGTLNITGATTEIPDMLAHYGWNHITENEMHFLDGSVGQNLMTMTPDGMGTPLTSGPGNRGLDFNNDADFQATGAITNADNYMNLFLGKIVVTQADIDAGGAFNFQVAGDDDRSGMWLDTNNNGVFDAAEQLAWEDTAREGRYLHRSGQLLVRHHPRRIRRRLGHRRSLPGPRHGRRHGDQTGRSARAMARHRPRSRDDHQRRHRQRQLHDQFHGLRNSFVGLGRAQRRREPHSEVGFRQSRRRDLRRSRRRRQRGLDRQ